MIGMGQTSEAFAHFVHGGVTVFFLAWAYMIWPLRKQNKMMNMLFLNMLCFGFCNLKDIIFLIDGYWESFFWSGVSVTMDLLYIPIVSNFFLEIVSPGWSNARRILVPVTLQAIFIPMFIMWPTPAVYRAAMCAAYLGGFIAFVLVCILLAKHRKYIRDNYSYTEHIDVTWAVSCVILLFICTTLYVIIFYNDTWLSGAVFQLICVGSWMYLYGLAIRHSVVETPPLQVFDFPWVRAEENVEEKAAYDTNAAIASNLDSCMADDKLYLNQKLTLQDVAVAIGTNRTYLSEYLNTVLQKTFYEYVNEFRIKEACTLIDSQDEADRKPMQEIAELSGFNSISTFNRSFIKIVGSTPSQYAAKNK